MLICRKDDMRRCLTWFPTWFHTSHHFNLVLLKLVLPQRYTVCPLYIDFAASDRFARYLAFHSSGHACQVLTGERHSFLINGTMLLLACVCQTTSIAWLTHQFKVARFVGCPATIITTLSPLYLPPHLPLEAFSHAWEVFSSQRELGSITLKWP